MSRFSPDTEALQLMRAGRLAEALPLAQRAVAGAQTCLPAHGLLASVLLQMGRANEAEEVITTALAFGGGVADAYDALAFVALHLGQHERSNALYRRATELAPTAARFWYNLASSERSFGRLSEAEAACDRAIGLDDRQYASYLLRSELRVQNVQSNHVEELQRRLGQSGLEDRARVFLGYALAKELDDLEQFHEAFRWFSQAASTRRRHLSYDVAVDEHKLKRVAEAFPGPGAPPSRSELIAANGTSLHPDRSGRYIFIVGLPRSGTTLVERIVMGLPDVRSNGETDHFARALLAASPAGDSNVADVFSRAAAADPSTVAANYMNLADRGARTGRIIEKLPMNYLYLGAIQRALPQAKLLVIRRSPLDSCFAMYRTLFGHAYPFSYDFVELARYYAAYERLMDHWRSTLGTAIHEVRYEDLVREPLKFGARIANACGLPWSDRAIEVHKNAAVSLTASAAQVRRPIYGSSSGRWRYYREHLAPLIAALGRYNVTLPEDA